MNAGQVADVPVVVRNKALVAGASRWLAGLPELIAGLEQERSIAVGRAYPDATEAFVAEATLEDGTAAVLKLLVPGAGNAAGNEITVLRLVNGEGPAPAAACQPAPRKAGGWPISSRRHGLSSTIRARNEPCTMPSDARPAGSLRTTTSGPSWCMVTCSRSAARCSPPPIG